MIGGGRLERSQRSRGDRIHDQSPNPTQDLPTKICFSLDIPRDHIHRAEMCDPNPINDPTLSPGANSRNFFDPSSWISGIFEKEK